MKTVENPEETNMRAKHMCTKLNLDIDFPNVICVEGNIGSGKSTLLKHLEENGIYVIQEPVQEIWAKHLPRLYQNPVRWGMTFQMEALHWYNKLKTEILPTLTSKKLVVVERSPHSTFHVFCENMLKKKIMNEWEYSICQRTFKISEWTPALTLYLQLDPEVCIERIKLRNRNGEDQIDCALIQNLHEKHEELFVENVTLTTRNLDASQSAEQVCEMALEYCKSFE